MDNTTLNEAWDKLKGNPVVKRALMVAWAGKHSIVVIGNPDNGKPHLDAISSGLGIDYSFLNPCLCGDLHNSVKVCTCPPKILSSLRNRRSFRQALISDIAVPLDRPYVGALHSQEPSLEMDMQWAKPNGDLELNKDIPLSREAGVLLEKAYEVYGLTLGAHERAVRVAKTIALMGGAEQTEPHHVAESIQYRPEPYLIHNSQKNYKWGD